MAAKVVTRCELGSAADALVLLLTDGSPWIRAADDRHCRAPSDVRSAIVTAREVTGKPVIVYPNSGEGLDAQQRAWVGAVAMFRRSSAALGHRRCASE